MDRTGMMVAVGLLGAGCAGPALDVSLADARAGGLEVSAPDARSAELEAFIDEALGLDMAPGAAVAVVRGDEVAFLRGYGWADIAGRRPVTPETPFYIASSTKSFTGTAAAILGEEGRLDLDAPLSRYLPGVTLRAPLSADSITLRQLLTHTHGMDNGGPIVLRTAFTGDHDPELLLRLLADQPPGEQGREFRYGNLGYNVASMVIDAELGTSWKDVLAEEIFGPLGMTATTAYMSRVDRQERAQPYGWEPAGWEAEPYSKGDANMHAAGGMVSTAADLARWLIANLNDGQLGGRQAIPAAAVREAHRALAENDDAWGPFSRDGYGLGWHVGTYDGSRQLHHFGGFPGFHAHVSFLPDERLGVAVLVNESDTGSELATAVAAFAYDAYRGVPGLATTRSEGLLAGLVQERDRARSAIRADRERRAARPQLLPHPPRAYAGIYENPAFGRTVWEVRGGRLHAAMGLARSDVEVYDGEANQLRAELTGGGTVVAFEFPEGAERASALTMFGARFERVE